MKSYLIRHGWAIWLGASLSYADIGFRSKEFWIILLPVCVLVGIAIKFGEFDW
jgi:hypothetical protein